MRHILLPIMASLPLLGCALGSGIVPVAPGVYALSEMRAPVRGGGPEAHRAVLAEAASFCQRQGRRLLILDLQPGGDPRIREWPTAFGLVFQCG